MAGTTGYDAMREANGVFVDHDHEGRLTELYQRLTGDRLSIAEHVEQGKRMVVTTLLPAERRRMAALVPDVPEAAEALGELAVAFGVYRSYLPEGVEHLDQALRTAATRRPDLARTLAALSPRLHDHRDELAVRMQQLSGATMAKGVEDTAYYRYARFIALNEVGGDPGQFGIPLAEFHALQAERQQRQPASMTGLTTHDTKRGEDVRARMAVLAEIPDRWAEYAETFLAATAVPNRAFGYFLAQTLAGTGPIVRERMHAYAEKAMREASDGTTWTSPDPALRGCGARRDRSGVRRSATAEAWDELDAFVTPHGWSNALGQKLVQLTMPGVPDVYQGTELWEDSLVDPDNRRPVDFAARRTLLAELAGSPPIDASGAAKLWVTRQALRARRDRPDLFTAYTPLFADGPASPHVVGFDRGGAITVATRLPVRLTAAGGWGATTLDLPGAYTDTLTERHWSGRVPIADLLDQTARGPAPAFLTLSFSCSFSDRGGLMATESASDAVVFRPWRSNDLKPGCQAATVLARPGK